VLRTVGEDHEPRLFSTWGAKAIAPIGKLPPTLEDRSILISMKRRAPGEVVDPFRSSACQAAAEPLRRKARRWATDNVFILKANDPVVPAELNDRAADNWRPLISIASVVGGQWPKHAREAAKALSADADEAETSVGVMLLSDLQDLFRESEGEPLPTEHILAELSKLDERPWGEWKKGKPMTAISLARVLKPFGIRPKGIRIGEKTPKGYNFENCLDAFRRYIQPAMDSEPQHPQQGNDPQ
jgi:Protein of unknown function (DUF3631)